MVIRICRVQLLGHKHLWVLSSQALVTVRSILFSYLDQIYGWRDELSSHFEAVGPQW